MRTRTTMGCIDAPLEGFSLPGRGGGRRLTKPKFLSLL